MTAPHHALSQVDPELAVALIRAEASPAVAAAAVQGFMDWRASLSALTRTVEHLKGRYPWMRARRPERDPAPEHAARAIVAGCLADERHGRLERPLVYPCRCGAVHAPGVTCEVSKLSCP